MTWTLISATPSPYARKVRIALQEKGIPFTKTPDHNPLEKLPVLILDDGKTAIYESHFILEWLEAKYPDPPLLPPASDVDARLFAKQVEVVCDGVCDALVLAFFEKQREVQSEPWSARQMRKADGGLRQLNTWLEQSGSGKFLINDRLSLADLAAGSMLGWMAIRWTIHPWRTQYPGLRKYYEGLETLQSFKDTRPSPQTMKDKIV